jgi:hypothetical protein
MKEMKKAIFKKTLVGKNIKKVATIKFTNTAWFDCAEGDIIPDVAADLTRDAADYVLNKKEQERFTIASALLNTVITGIVTYRDLEEVELLITNVYNDVYFVDSTASSDDVYRVD